MLVVKEKSGPQLSTTSEGSTARAHTGEDIARQLCGKEEETVREFT
jgi:hypothetical protein